METIKLIPNDKATKLNASEFFLGSIIVSSYRMVVKTPKKAAILENNVKVVDEAIAHGEEAIFLANAAQKMVLEHFNVNDSTAIIVTVENAIQMQLICENIVTFDKNVHSIVKVANGIEKEIIEEIGVNHVLNGKELLAERLATEALACRVIE